MYKNKVQFITVMMALPDNLEEALLANMDMHVCVKVRAREKVAAEQMQKAQTIARDARSYVKRQAAVYEQQKTHLAQKLEDMRDRWTPHQNTCVHRNSQPSLGHSTESPARLQWCSGHGLSCLSLTTLQFKLQYLPGRCVETFHLEAFHSSDCLGMASAGPEHLCRLRTSLIGWEVACTEPPTCRILRKLARSAKQRLGGC